MKELESTKMLFNRIHER
jgi:hypothetical protein